MVVHSNRREDPDLCVLEQYKMHGYTEGPKFFAVRCYDPAD
jgi:hypothetical protein